MTAAIMNIENIYLPQMLKQATLVPGMINLLLTLSIMVSVIIIFYNATPGWIKAFRLKGAAMEQAPEEGWV